LHQYCDEARELVNSGAYDAAIGICRHILERYPRHLETYRILGEACLEKGELEEATDIFKRVLSADPEDFVAYAGLGVVSEKRGLLEAAIWHMQRSFELAPNNAGIRDTLRRLYAKRDGTEPGRLRLNKAALARMYAKGRQHRQAIEQFQDLLDLDPDRMDIKVSLAETLWRDGRREQAATVAGEILETLPECLKAILLLGIVLMEKGRTKQARAVLAEARGVDPDGMQSRAFFGEDSLLPVLPLRIPRAEEEPERQAVSLPAEAHQPVSMPPTEQEPQQSTLAWCKWLTQFEADDRSVGSDPDEQSVREGAAETQPTEEAAPVGASPTSAEAAYTETESMPAEEAGTGPERPTVSTANNEATTAEETLASGEAAPPSPLSDVERHRRQLEQKPKDDSARLALARAYRDREQMEMALEQYGALVRARSKLLPEAIRDMESIVASRPDNLQAHELLADLYTRSGQLRKAIERLRWIQHRLGQKHA